MAAAAQTSSSPILNPDVYLNYFPPDIGKQFELARNIFLVTLGALLCDMIVALPDDLGLMKAGIGPVMVAYGLSRISALAFVLSSVIAKTGPQPNCAAQELGVALCWIIASASSSFLFLRRARAVFHNRRLWRHFYSCLFIINIGISFVVPIGSRAGPLGQTGWCINTRVEAYVTAAIFSRLVYDSSIFLGITYQVATAEELAGVPVTWHTIMTGQASSRLLQALLRGGQQYYLISVCSNLLISLLIVIPGVPPLYQVMFTIPDLALSSTMACRVFRNLRMSADCTEFGTSTSIEFPGSRNMTSSNLGADIFLNPLSQDRFNKNDLNREQHTERSSNKMNIDL